MDNLFTVVAPVDVMSLNDDDMGGRQKPILRRGFQRYEEEPESDSGNASSGDESVGDPRPDTPMGTLGRGTPRPSLTSSRPNSPEIKPREQINWSFRHLPWAPKVTPKEMNEYISSARMKYLDYSFAHDVECEETLKIINQNRFGLPEPIQKSLGVMDKHIYISLAERQRNQEQGLLYKNFDFYLRLFSFSYFAYFKISSEFVLEVRISSKSRCL